MSAPARNTLGSEERIKSRKLMERLFNSGQSQSVTAFPLRLVYVRIAREEGRVPYCMMVSVSKRCFKRAVKRNRAKRQMREAYRLHKSLRPAVGDDETLLMAFIWMDSQPHDSKRVVKSLCRLYKKMEEMP